MKMVRFFIIFPLFLFYLFVFEDEWKMELAQQTAPRLMNRICELIQHFTKVESKSGKIPVPRALLTELTFVLSQMKTITVHPTLVLVDGDDKLPVNFSISERKHLLFLFSLLCECITTREESIKPLLKEIFHLTAVEVGLGQVPSAAH